MKRRALLVWLMALALVVGVGTPSEGAVFGSGPYTATYNAAAAKVRCQLSANKLTALMLSITWAEVTANKTELVPSPMTLSRSDKRTYFQHPSMSYPRAYWHPGIGMWQIDDAGMGVNMSYEKFMSGKSASVVATTIAARYCQYGLSNALFQGWYGCHGGSTCMANYRAIYVNGAVQVRKSTVEENGGSKMQSCRLYGHTTRFNCLFVNPASAQGYNSYWRDTYPNGTSSMTPVSKAFFVYAQNINGVLHETRVWPKTYTGYGSSVLVRRAYGKGSRTGGVLRWGSWSTGTRLCVKATSTSTEVCH